MELVGSGTFGHVLPCDGKAPRHDENVLLAVRIFFQKPESGQKSCEFLAKFHHENAVKCLGSGMNYTKTGPETLIVSEFCKGKYVCNAAIRAGLPSGVVKDETTTASDWLFVCNKIIELLCCIL